MSEKYSPGTVIEFPAQRLEHGEKWHYKIIENCKMPGDICIESDGRIFSYDEDFLDKNAIVITAPDPEAIKCWVEE